MSGGLSVLFSWADTVGDAVLISRLASFPSPIVSSLALLSRHGRFAIRLASNAELYIASSWARHFHRTDLNGWPALHSIFILIFDITVVLDLLFDFMHIITYTSSSYAYGRSIQFQSQSHLAHRALILYYPITYLSLPLFLLSPPRY